LDAPDTLLIVGAYSPNYISGIVTANIFIRNDVNSSWDQVLVYEGGFPAGENYSMRDIEIYTSSSRLFSQKITMVIHWIPLIHCS